MTLWNYPRAGHPVRLNSEEEIPITPEAYYLPKPLRAGNKFYVQLSEINKKPLKYVGIGSVGILMASLGPAPTKHWKKCCRNEWKIGDQEMHHKEPASPLFYGYRKLEDIKPVSEYIEDDLQYDFRTKTHSI
ncbi:hypothetical protein JTB14_037346 [Gonioctena quinquepunctata]|nr:hypothetical protein JTB14_037346 [Gonioctena quinquepunctata]